MDDNWVTLILLIIMAIALLTVFLLAGWKWGSKLCSCCRRSKKAATDSEVGIEMRDNTKSNMNKESKQKSDNDATRERAQGSGYAYGKPYGSSMAPPSDDKLEFDEDDLKESEEKHPHESEKPTPVSEKTTALDFEDIDLNSGHAVKPKDMV